MLIRMASSIAEIEKATWRRPVSSLKAEGGPLLTARQDMGILVRLERTEFCQQQE